MDVGAGVDGDSAEEGQQQCFPQLVMGVFVVSICIYGTGMGWRKLKGLCFVW